MELKDFNLIDDFLKVSRKGERVITLDFAFSLIRKIERMGGEGYLGKSGKGCFGIFTMIGTDRVRIQPYWDEQQSGELIEVSNRSTELAIVLAVVQYIKWYNNIRQRNVPQVIESYLPIFGGFNPHIYDVKGSKKNIARKIFKVIKNEIESRGLAKVKFQTLWSPPPQDSTFTDQIQVIYTLNAKNVNAIRGYVLDNNCAFDAYLKENFTSYNGFTSFYPNNVDDFMSETDSLTDFTKPNSYQDKAGQWVGIVLDFILEKEGWDDKRIYNTISL